MADKKEPVKRKIVKASSGEAKIVSEVKIEAEKKGNSGALRIFAAVCWLIGIAFEVLAVMMLNGTLYLPGMPDKLTIYLIIAIVADVIFIIIGSQLWKKANHIDPASERNKLKFFLWNNMGVIASVVAFMPVILILVSNRQLDAKTKRLVTVIAAAALVIAGVFSVDYDPVSQEEMAAAESRAAVQGIDTVYWTPFGRSYHLDPDCQTLLRSATIYEGSLDEAFAARRADPCDFCALDFAQSVEDAAAEPAA